MSLFSRRGEFLEPRGFGGDAHDFDFDAADGVEAEVLAVNIADFLGEVALDRVEFGIGADAEADHGLKLAPAA